jgi:hypothetical protein
MGFTGRQENQTPASAQLTRAARNLSLRPSVRDLLAANPPRGCTALLHNFLRHRHLEICSDISRSRTGNPRVRLRFPLPLRLSHSAPKLVDITSSFPSAELWPPSPRRRLLLQQCWLRPLPPSHRALSRSSPA